LGSGPPVGKAGVHSWMGTSGFEGVEVLWSEQLSLLIVLEPGDPTLTLTLAKGRGLEVVFKGEVGVRFSSLRRQSIALTARASLVSV
jgi:hypothetical protein